MNTQLKRTLIGICIAIAIAGIAGIYLLASINGSPRDDFATLPQPGLVPVTYEEDDGVNYVTITTVDGEVVIPDPRDREGTTALGGGLHLLTTIAPDPNLNFGIVFQEENGSFAISLEAEPIAQTRRAAEAYFLSLTGLSESEVCALPLFVGVPYQVNEFYAGQNLGLSFCAGSVPLE